MKYFGYFVVVLVLLAVCYGLYLVGSPNAARLQNLDNQRVSDLQYLQNQIIYYWQAKQVLPVALSELNDATRGVGVPVDPESRSAYGYSIKNSLEFSLCANFAMPSTDQTGSLPGIKTAPVAPVEYGYPAESSWSHDAGSVCFERKIDTAFYKPLK